MCPITVALLSYFFQTSIISGHFFVWQKPVNHGFEAMWTSKHSFMPYRSNHENSGGLLAAGENMYFVDGHSGWVSYEGPGSSDAVLVMKCYRRLWDLMLAAD